MTKASEDKTKPAVFSAVHGHFSGYLYPYQAKPGWRWTVWRKSNDDVVSDELQSGHVEPMPIAAAADTVLKALFAAVAEFPQPTFRVLVCGSPPAAEHSLVPSFLDRLHENRGPITELIAIAEDNLAASWAVEHDVQCPPPSALLSIWRSSGRTAATQNKAVLTSTKPHFVVAFGPGRTAVSMRHQAELLGISAATPRTAESGSYL